MSILGFIVLVIVAAVAGSLGQALAGFSRGGCLASILVGFIGAYLGWWLAGELGLPPVLVLNIDGQPFPLVWAIIGSALFAGVLGILARTGGRHYGPRRSA
jgi:uncharacterized membrane protein YeaQ/YmgE (transglycosylase-associated protein family)